METQDSLGPTH